MADSGFRSFLGFWIGGLSSGAAVVTSRDTHDLPRRIHLPIYENQKKKKKKLKKIVQVAEKIKKSVMEESVFPVAAIKWDYGQWEDYAQKTSQSLDAISQRLEEIKLYEQSLDEEEELILMLVAAANA